MREFRLFRWFKRLLGEREPQRPAAQAVAPTPVVPPREPLAESLVELNAAMRSLDNEMLRLAQAWQALGTSLESLKKQKSQAEVEVQVFSRIDSSRLN